MPKIADARILILATDGFGQSELEVPRDRLRAEGLPGDLAIALDAVTRREGEDYLDFVRRSGRNGTARAVKIADLRDNLDMTRIASPGETDRRRMARYRQALEILGALPD